MTTLKVHYEGWVSLPSALRQKLGVGSGDRLEADLVDGAIVLRPAVRGRRPPRRGEEGAGLAVDMPPMPAVMPVAAADANPARRKPGRPRKIAGADELAPAAAPRKARGRPRKTTTVREPETAILPVVAIGPPKLLKKADLQPKAPSADPALSPADAIKRTRSDSGFRPVAGPTHEISAINAQGVVSAERVRR